jgi:hypothetical protein
VIVQIVVDLVGAAMQDKDNYNNVNSSVGGWLCSVIKKCLQYDPETGDLIWIEKYSKYSNVSVGETAGYVGKTATKVNLGGVYLQAHRVAWYLHYGEWPDTFIDHINGNPNDNRIVNLRLATRRQNSVNRKTSENSSSKYLGVCYVKRTRRWQASIGTPRVYLGQYKTENEAAIAYNEAAKIRYGEFARLNEVEA